MSSTAPLPKSPRSVGSPKLARCATGRDRSGSRPRSRCGSDGLGLAVAPHRDPAVPPRGQLHLHAVGLHRGHQATTATPRRIAAARSSTVTATTRNLPSRASSARTRAASIAGVRIVTDARTGAARARPKPAPITAPDHGSADEEGREPREVHRGGRDDRDDPDAELEPEAHSVDPAAVIGEPVLVHLPVPRRDPSTGEIDQRGDDGRGRQRAELPRAGRSTPTPRLPAAPSSAARILAAPTSEPTV